MDTKANRKKFPGIRNGSKNVGFPRMRVVVLFCLASGAILARLTGNKRACESRLFHQQMSTLNIEQLRCKTPAMVEKELLAALIGHNLVRWLMAEVSRRHDVDMERISFKGALDALRQFAHAISQARSAKKRRELWSQMLQALAEDLAPERPDVGNPELSKDSAINNRRSIQRAKSFAIIPNEMNAGNAGVSWHPLK